MFAVNTVLTTWKRLVEALEIPQCRCMEIRKPRIDSPTPMWEHLSWDDPIVLLLVGKERWVGKLGGHPLVEQKPAPGTHSTSEYSRVGPTRDRREISLQDRTLIPHSQDLDNLIGLHLYIGQQLYCRYLKGRGVLYPTKQYCSNKQQPSLRWR